jgi:hypothetical protein
MHDEHHGPNMSPEEIKELLDVVAEKIPDLLEKLSDILYSKENAEKYGDAVATFYSRLIDAGMEPDQAFKLTERYMSSLSPMSAVSQAIGSKHRSGNGDDDQ